VVAGAAFVTLLVASGVRSTPAILFVPLREEFGWDAATVSVAVTINLLLFGLAGPFAAALMDRWGMRLVVSAAMAMIAAAAFLSARMDQPWQLDLLWGGLSGLGVGAISTVLAAMIAARWFVHRRGLVMGICSAASGSGQMLSMPMLATAVASVGWRGMCILIGVVAVLTVPLAAGLLRDRPEQLGLLPYGATASDPLPANRHRNPITTAFRTLGEVSHNRGFWALSLSFMLCGATTTGILGTHLIPASVDHGLSQVDAASLLGVVGFVGLVATLISGWLTDRFDPRKLLAIYYLSRSAAMFALPGAFDTEWQLLVAMAVHGFDWVATLPPTAALATELFGRERGPQVVGWVFVGHQIGAAGAAYAIGLSRVMLGSYDPGFLAAGLVSIAAAAFAMMVPYGETRSFPTTPLLPDAPLIQTGGAAPAGGRR
jgi:sugar phosphate permease